MPLVGVMGTMTDELHSLSSTIASSQHNAPNVQSRHNVDGQPYKRRRTETGPYDSTERCTNTSSIAVSSVSESSMAEGIDALSGEILEAYFQYIQPWLSILYEFPGSVCTRLPGARMHLASLGTTRSHEYPSYLCLRY
jgi:hypothetical protein